MAETSQVTALVLMGGKSRRLGRDKRVVLVDGETLLGRTIKLVRPLTAETALLCAPGDELAASAARRAGARIIADRNPGAGPARALADALVEITTEYGLLIACDLPRMSAAFLTRLLGAAGDAQATVPRHDDGRIEPACAIYRADALAAAGGEEAPRSLMGVVERLDVEFFGPRDYGGHDWDKLFFNLNEPEDIQRLKREDQP